MSFSAKMTDDLVKIASAGGGFELNANGRKIEDLIKIAGAARSGNCVVIMTGVGRMPTSDLLAIAKAGPGHVRFVGLPTDA
jgi:hypothetical protein